MNKRQVVRANRQLKEMDRVLSTYAKDRQLDMRKSHGRVDDGPDTEVWCPGMPYLKRLRNDLTEVRKEVDTIIVYSAEELIGYFGNLTQEEINYREKLLVEVLEAVGMRVAFIVPWDATQEEIDERKRKDGILT